MASQWLQGPLFRRPGAWALLLAEWVFDVWFERWLLVDVLDLATLIRTAPLGAEEAHHQ